MIISNCSQMAAYCFFLHHICCFLAAHIVTLIYGGDIMCGIGNYIETNRNKQNMSIRELAKKAGISHTEINKIENGTRQKPSAKNLKLIAKALQLPQLDLLIKANYISDLPASIKSIFLECSDLTEQEILQVCRFIKFIKRERFEKSSERLNDNDI